MKQSWTLALSAIISVGAANAQTLDQEYTYEYGAHVLWDILDTYPPREAWLTLPQPTNPPRWSNLIYVTNAYPEERPQSFRGAYRLDCDNGEGQWELITVNGTSVSQTAAEQAFPLDPQYSQPMPDYLAGSRSQPTKLDFVESLIEVSYCHMPRLAQAIQEQGQVRELQAALSQSRISIVTEDGVWGRETESALAVRIASCMEFGMTSFFDVFSVYARDNLYHFLYTLRDNSCYIYEAPD